MNDINLILKNVKFAAFRSLADGSIRISFDTQELSVEDTRKLISLYKEKECSVNIGTGEIFDIGTDFLATVENLTPDQLRSFLKYAEED